MTTKQLARVILANDRRFVSRVQRELGGQSVATRVLELPEVIAADTVALYISNSGEVPTDTLLDRLSENSTRTILLPAWRDGHWDFVVWRRGEELLPGEHGILAPKGPTWVPTGRGVVAIVPLVGWDACGLRIGHGGGHYDRLLGCLRKVARLCVIGIAYECQRTLGLSRDTWDEPLDMVVTERRTIRMQTLVRTSLSAAGMCRGDR